jgi:hypothetical protein
VSSGGDAKALETLYRERYEDFLRIARSDHARRLLRERRRSGGVRACDPLAQHLSRRVCALDGWVWAIVAKRGPEVQRQTTP